MDMSAGQRHTPEFRFADIEAFLAITRYGSVNGAARSLGVSPSQVSKSLARLEMQVGARLIARSALGASPSDAGRRLTPQFVEVLARVRALRGAQSTSELTIVGSAFLTAYFLPRIAIGLPQLRVHSLETPPGTSSAYAGLPLFDVALTSAGEHWPESWIQVRAGFVRKALFASPAVAKRLGARVDAAQLRDEIFIGPIYGDRGQVAPGDDGCPLTPLERHFGHRTQTVAVALDLAAQLEQLVFAPVISARVHVERRALVEIPVEGWNVRDPLNLVCHQERVGARVQQSILASIKASLKD